MQTHSKRKIMGVMFMGEHKQKGEGGGGLHIPKKGKGNF